MTRRHFTILHLDSFACMHFFRLARFQNKQTKFCRCFRWDCKEKIQKNNFVDTLKQEYGLIHITIHSCNNSTTRPLSYKQNVNCTYLSHRTINHGHAVVLLPRMSLLLCTDCTNRGIIPCIPALDLLKVLQAIRIIHLDVYNQQLPPPPPPQQQQRNHLHNHLFLVVSVYCCRKLMPV